ncbi:hypothetical protein ACJX0J_022783, partial [Zea mays]
FFFTHSDLGSASLSGTLGYAIWDDEGDYSIFQILQTTYTKSFATKNNKILDEQYIETLQLFRKPNRLSFGYCNLGDTENGSANVVYTGNFAEIETYNTPVHIFIFGNEDVKFINTPTNDTTELNTIFYVSINNIFTILKTGEKRERKKIYSIVMIHAFDMTLDFPAIAECFYCVLFT